MNVLSKATLNVIFILCYAVLFLRILCKFDLISADHMVMVWISGSQSVLRRYQRICDQFLGDPSIHFCNDCFEFYFFN